MRGDDEPRLPDPRMIPVAQPQSWFEQPGGAVEHSVATGQSATDDTDGAFVRPFIVTRGRTRPLHDGLRIETLVEARPAALSAPLQFEQRQIVELAQRPVSVAEVAALLGVPLGVARVLIADLFTGNYVSLHEPTELPVHVIERIRDLVRAL
ncbi:MAG TPA: DUF742 domain-containing protein [Pseudonocardiaceae bacterium]|jgi:hypothetical protein|nr:DUF742 domain-containing protein [Pseudonocardiaceae bacterium]